MSAKSETHQTLVRLILSMMSLPCPTPSMSVYAPHRSPYRTFSFSVRIHGDLQAKLHPACAMRGVIRGTHRGHAHVFTPTVYGQHTHVTTALPISCTADPFGIDAVMGWKSHLSGGAGSPFNLSVWRLVLIFRKAEARAEISLLAIHPPIPQNA